MIMSLQKYHYTNLDVNSFVNDSCINFLQKIREMSINVYKRLRIMLRIILLRLM